MNVYLVEESDWEWDPIDSVWSTLEAAKERADVLAQHPSLLVKRVKVYEIELDTTPPSSINDLTDISRQGAMDREAVYEIEMERPK